MTKATFWERLAAKIIDRLILKALAGLVLMLIVLQQSTLSTLINGLLLFLVLLILLPLLDLFYNSYFVSRFGGTIGKLVLGLEVLDENSKRLTTGHSLYRHTAGYLVSGVCFGLGYFWTLRKDRTAWHDLLTNSYVIKKVQNRGLITLVVLVTLAVVVALEAGATVSLLVTNSHLTSDFQNIGAQLNALETTPSALPNLPLEPPTSQI